MRSSTSAVARAGYLLLALVAIVAVLLSWFPSIAVADNQIDLWYNFGLFFNFPHALHWLPDTRQISRVPVVLPGYILTHLFGIMTASYVLFLFYYLATLILFYYAVSRLISRKVAVFGTIFLATNAYIIGDFSTTLADAPAVVYNTAALFLVAYAVTAKKRLHVNLAIFGSGVAVALALHSHLIALPYAGANYVIYLVWEIFFASESIATRAARLAFAALLVATAIILTTAILGAIIVFGFHGSFGQIFNDFTYIPDASAANALYYHSDWYRYGPDAGLFLVALLLALLTIFRTRRDAAITGDRREHKGLVATSVAVVALWAVMFAYNQFGGIFLQFSSYFFCFMPYLALVLFGPIAPELERCQFRRTTVIFYGGSILVALLREHWISRLYDVPYNGFATIACAVVIGLVCTLFLAPIPAQVKRGAFSIFIVLVLALAVIGRPDEGVGSFIWKDNHQQAESQRALYVRLGEGETFLNRLNFETYPKFWVDEANVPESAVYPRSYMEYRFQRFAKIDEEGWHSPHVDFARFLAGDYVVVISDQNDLATRARQAFARLGLRVTEVAKTRVSYAGVRYDILAEHVTGGHKLAHGTTMTDAFASPYGRSVVKGVPTKAPFTLTMPAQKWSYGAIFPLKDEALTGPFSVRIVARIADAPVGIGIVDRREKNFFDRTIVGPSKDEMALTLRVTDPDSVGGLIFESADALGSHAVIYIQSMSVSATVGHHIGSAVIRDAFCSPVGPSVPSGTLSGPPFRFLMPAQRGQYGAVFAARDKTLIGPFSIQVLLQVRDAPAAVAVSDPATTRLLDKAVVQPSARLINVTLHVKGPIGIGNLVLESVGDGRPARVEVRRVLVMAG